MSSIDKEDIKDKEDVKYWVKVIKSNEEVYYNKKCVIKELIDGKVLCCDNCKEYNVNCNSLVYKRCKVLQ